MAKTKLHDKQRARKEAGSFLSSLLSRKFLVSMVCLAIGTVVDLYTTRGLSDNLLTFLVAITGMYTSGNLIAKEVKRRRDTPSKGAESSDSGQLEKKLEETKNQLNEAQAQVGQLKEQQGQYESYISGIASTIESLQQQQAATNKRVAALIQGGTGQ